MSLSSKCAVTAVALIIALTAMPQIALAQIFDEDIAYFRDNIRTIVEQTGRNELMGFVEMVLPELNRIYENNEFGIRENLENIAPCAKLKKDFLIFAYEKSRMKLNAPFGAWDNKIKDNVFFVMELICPIKEFLNLKPESYQARMRELNTMLVRNYYAATLRWLCLSRSFYEIQLDDVRRRGAFPTVDEMISPLLLQFANNQAGGE